MKENSLRIEKQETKSEADRVLRLLTERAERLANRDEAAARRENIQSILIFTLGEERFAVRMSEVSAVAPLTKLTLVPTADSKILGAMAIKGDVHCIFDLPRLLDLPQPGRDTGSERENSYVVVLRIPGEHLGFAVNRIDSIDEIDEQTKPTVAGYEIDLRRWTGRRFVKPQFAPPLILIENFKQHLLTLLQEVDQ